MSRGRTVLGVVLLAMVWFTAAARGQSTAIHSSPPRPADVVLDVPFVGQSEALCGGAAVAMAFRYWGDRSFQPQRFAHLVTDDGRGIVPVDLERETAALGWTAASFTGSVAQIEAQMKRGRPVIALIKVAPGRFHYVAVVGRLGDRIVYHDPAVSPFQTVGLDDFDAAWAASDRWAMLVLPPSVPDGPGLTADPVAANQVQEPADSTLRPDRDLAESEATSESGCTAAVAEAIKLARGGDPETAARLLESMTQACPHDALVPRELSAVRLRMGQGGEAVRAARSALALDPEDRHAAELLAAALYLDDRQEEALEVWSGLDGAPLADLQLASPTRTRQQVVLEATGLEVGRRLTRRDLELARRRVATLPTRAASRVDYRPGEDESMGVSVGLLEAPVVPSFPLGIARILLRAAFDEEIRVRSASPTRSGESLETWVRWDARRPGLGVGVDLPGRLILPGNWSLEGTWSRATFGATLVEENRRRAALGFGAWPDPSVHLGIGVALDRWEDLGTWLSPSARADVYVAGDQAAFGLESGVWIGGSGDFARLSGDVRARTSPEFRDWVLSGRAGYVYATGDAPLTVWPGAGRGGSRDGRARAHGLVNAGVVDGPLFGRSLGYGGAELVRWIEMSAPLRLGFATFVDLAAVENRLEGAVGEAFHIDAGFGLRLGLPGGAGMLRVDAARGLRDGEMALSAGLEPAWIRRY